MVPKPRDPNLNFFHISVYPLHRDFIYLIPTIQLDVKPFNGDKLHIRVYLFIWVVQLEIIASKVFGIEI